MRRLTSVNIVVRRKHACYRHFVCYPFLLELLKLVIDIVRLLVLYVAGESGGCRAGAYHFEILLLASQMGEVLELELVARNLG